MKKRYRIALAACMTAAALTACQGKAAEPDASALFLRRQIQELLKQKKRNRVGRRAAECSSPLQPRI